MSPVAARIASKAILRRQFSVLSSARSMAPGIEMRPFNHMPFTQKAARADWTRLFKDAATNVALFFPAIGLLLGWPLLAKEVVETLGVL